MNSNFLSILKSNKYLNYLYKKTKSNLIELLEIIKINGRNNYRNIKNDNYFYYSINSWKRFSIEVRQKQKLLLCKLNNFPESVLVTGCQRSGTTMLSRIITQSDEMVKYWTGRDDELDAALILSGMKPYHSTGRHCFQTTYLNERFEEYYDLLNGQMGHKLIWVLRNPYSVVFSMLYNWDDFALNELFQSCGQKDINNTGVYKKRYLRKWRESRLERACFAYNGKTSQVFELVRDVNRKSMMVVDYEDLINNKELTLQLIFKYIEIPYRKSYTGNISDKSDNKYKLLSKREIEAIKSICMPVYEEAKSFSIC